MTALIRLLAAGALVVGAFGAVFVVGMRAQWPPVLNAVTRMNKAVFNPMQMKKAGEPGAYAGIIRHVGRTSGKAYETPISPMRAGDGFLVMLPYGTSPDWLKNIRAAGTAELVFEGSTYAVTGPRIIGFDEAGEFLGEKERKTAQRFGMEDFLLLDDAATSA